MYPQPAYTFTTISRAALPMAVMLLPRWLPAGRFEGREYVALNPVRQDKHLGSFRVNITTGKWADFACNARGGDMISLYAYVHQVSQRDALHQVARLIGRAR